MYVMSNNTRKACCLGLHSKLVLRRFGITPGGLDVSPEALESTQLENLRPTASREPGDEDRDNLRNVEFVHHIEAVNYLGIMHLFSQLGNFNVCSEFRQELTKSKISGTYT
jgi:hypothetical protein